MKEVDAIEKNYTELLLNCTDKFSVLIKQTESRLMAKKGEDKEELKV